MYLSYPEIIGKIYINDNLRKCYIILWRITMSFGLPIILCEKVVKSGVVHVLTYLSD